MEFKKDDSSSIPKSSNCSLDCKVTFIKMSVNKGSVQYEEGRKSGHDNQGRGT